MKETLTFRLALVFQIQEMTVKFLILIWVYFMNKLLYYKKIKVFRTITLEKIKYGLLKKAYSDVLSKCSCSGKFYWNPKKTLWVEYLFTKHTDWANILNDKFLALSLSLSLSLSVILLNISKQLFLIMTYRLSPLNNLFSFLPLTFFSMVCIVT